MSAPGMELAPPSGAGARPAATSPPDYGALGAATVIATGPSKIGFRAGTATVEVTALAPDLFRVGLFPEGRSVDYSSVAVVAREWQPEPATIVEEPGEVTLSTAVAIAHLSLAPLRIGFPDHAGRAFAIHHPGL